MMMKKRKAKMGKFIRKQTGITLPVAMEAAKAVINFDVHALHSKFSCIELKRVGTCSCCSSINVFLIGPKGNLDLSELQFTKISS